jgi:glycosyltransferase involved in cell wall biosynthesis
MDKWPSPVSVVHIASGDLWAGAEVQLYHLAKELDKNKQIHLEIVLLNHGILEDKLTGAGIPVTVFDETRLNVVQIFLRLRAYLKTLSPGIIHTHRQKENVLGSTASMLSGRARSLRTVHGASESRPRLIRMDKHLFRILDWLTGRLLQDKIVAVSTQLARQLGARFPAHKIRSIENGIDVEELQAAAAAPVALPGPPDAIKIAMVGRLVPVKRADIYLHTARLLAQDTDRHYAFYIFGEGPLRDDTAALARTLNISQHVYMMGFQTNLAAYLSKMDFLLITSDHEGLPLNLLEAMGLRIPVIAHAVGGIPEVLDNGKCGVLVRENTPENYAAAITRCLSDGGHLTTMVESAYRRLLKRYAIKQTAYHYAQLYAEILSSSKTG